MSKFMCGIVAEKWLGPLIEWALGKTTNHLVNAESYDEALEIISKQAILLNASAPPGVRYCVSWVEENPSDAWIARTNPKSIAEDPMPGIRLPRLNHHFGYSTVTEQYLRGECLIAKVIFCLDSGDCAFISQDKTGLYATRGVDKAHKIAKKNAVNEIRRWEPNKFLLVPDESGSIDWRCSIPNLADQPEMLKWVLKVDKAIK